MTSKQIGIDDARKTLGHLVEDAIDGAEIVLTRHGRPIARIVPIEEPRTPTTIEWIGTLRTFATVPPVVDTLGIGDREPGLTDLGRAQLAIEAHPFAQLVADLDAFFGDELAQAFSGPEADEAEAEAWRIIGDHLARAKTRLAVGAALLPQTSPAIDPASALNLAHVTMQRAADQRFVNVTSKATT